MLLVLGLPGEAAAFLGELSIFLRRFHGTIIARPQHPFLSKGGMRRGTFRPVATSRPEPRSPHFDAPIKRQGRAARHAGP